MSDFSDKCRFYLHESGSNVYQIAHIAGLDRTTVQRMLTGKRLPSREFVKTFCKHLRISTIEKKELMEAYSIEKVGNSTYQNRRYVEKLIEHISSYQDVNHAFSSDFSLHIPTAKLVEKVLRQVFLDSSNQTIRTNVPASYEFLYYELISLHKEFKKNVLVKHIFSMHPNPLSIPDSNVNLEKLYYVIPFLFSNYEAYEPSFYYSRNMDADYSTQVFPFYIITSTSVLLLSSDLKIGLLHDDMETVRKYTDIFEKISVSTRPLMSNITDPLVAMVYYNDILNKYGMPTLSLEFQPCIFAYLSTPSQLSMLCPEDLPGRDFLISACTKGYSSYYHEINKHRTICTMEGLRHFADTGELSGACTVFASPLPAANRKKLIQHFFKLYNTTESFNVTRNSFHLSPNLQLEIYGNHLLHIICADRSAFRFLAFTESSLCEAFNDFLDSMSDSESIVSPQQLKDEFSSILQ